MITGGWRKAQWFGVLAALATGVRFPVPTWWVITICNSSSREICYIHTEEHLHTWRRNVHKHNIKYFYKNINENYNDLKIQYVEYEFST